MKSFSQFCASSWAQLWIVLTLAAAAPAYGSEPLVSARNYHEVSETLVSSGQISPAHIASLTDERVELVINLTVEDTDLNAREGFDITALGIDYLHIPVDWDNPTEQNLQLFMHVLDAAVIKKS